jgi:hypothetical protein
MANAKLEEGMRIEGEYVVIVKRITPRASKSGKSMLLASTSGRETFSHEGKDVQVNLNVYTLNG